MPKKPLVVCYFILIIAFLLTAILDVIQGSWVAAGTCVASAMAAIALARIEGQAAQIQELKDELGKLKAASTDAPEGTWPNPPSPH